MADEFEGFPDKIKDTRDSLASIFRAGTKGLSDDVAGLVNDQLPALETWAETLSYTMKQSVGNLRSELNTQRVSDILTGGAQTWANLAPGLDRYVSGILRAGQATTPVLKHMTRDFEKSAANRRQCDPEHPGEPRYRCWADSPAGCSGTVQARPCAEGSCR